MRISKAKSITTETRDTPLEEEDLREGDDKPGEAVRRVLEGRDGATRTTSSFHISFISWTALSAVTRFPLLQQVRRSIGTGCNLPPPEPLTASQSLQNTLQRRPVPLIELEPTSCSNSPIWVG